MHVATAPYHSQAWILLLGLIFYHQITVQSHAFNKNVASVDMQRERSEFKTKDPLQYLIVLQKKEKDKLFF